MPQPDYRGARGSNAGDDFHELWALRQALSLLDQDTRLAAIAVEGLKPEDESGTRPDTWDGVDCTFYFGGNNVASAERIVIDQLKYSAANPEKTWTVARLTRSTNKKGDNSVIARLAKAFGGLMRMRADLVVSGNLQVRLVSNQQVNAAVLKALLSDDSYRKSSAKQEEDRAALFAASGLSSQAFHVFSKGLDLSECGSRSRFATEEKILTTISSWTEDDARPDLDHLMRFVRRMMMMPESKGEVITRESILAQLGFSDAGALFPCPSVINRVDRLISREESQALTDQMLAGNQRICFHGVAGSGKTTLLQDIATRLPEGSILITYDCYGGGRYLDSDAYRHRPQDAFLQLSNDLARQLRTPPLVTKSTGTDFPRVFKKRLEKAAEIVASESSKALLVIVADAADNSITAATTRSPPEPSFIQGFVQLGDLPSNVRLIVTARTGRLSTLKLPASFGSPFEVTGFSRHETATHVRSVWNDSSESWIDDFHYFTNANPRVQRYALEYAGIDHPRALEYLRPHGKNLNNIFEGQLNHARLKLGLQQDIKTFCAGLVALPRPVPLEVISTVTNLSVADISDLCSDLAPGVRLKNGLIGFADEDFEDFMRIEGESQLGVIKSRIADYFVSQHTSNAYAAIHIASALLSASRGLEIIDLIKSEGEPTAIGDPVLRRQVQLQRLKIAMKVCRETGTDADAMLTVLIGAEALKTDEAIRNMLASNPDLAANFARDTSSRMILRDPLQIESHGPLLLHFMATDALEGDGISVREGFRQVRAWMQRRDDDAEERKRAYPHASPHRWSIGEHDVAAEIEAILRIAGPNDAVHALGRWRPRSLALNVALPLAFKLVTAGDHELVERCITEGAVSTPWDLFLLTPLALAGREVELSRLEVSLATLLRRGLIRVDAHREIWREEGTFADYLETILTACEIVIFRGGNTRTVIPVLERFADQKVRQLDGLFTSQVRLNDLSLRAHALLECLNGRQLTLETYLVDPPQPPADLSPEELERLKKSRDEKKTELEAFIGPFVELYDTRAQLLVGSITRKQGKKALESAISSSQQEDYRLRRDFSLPAMRTRAALSLARLIVIPNLDRAILFDHACAISRAASNPFSSAQARIFGSLALERSLHQRILSAVTASAKKIEITRISSEEKITSLVRLSRLLLSISRADAQILFNRAIAVSGEINVDAVHEIALFEPLARRASNIMTLERRRVVAADFATVVSDAWIRLEGQENFPWPKVSRALCTLDVSLALAAIARWEDVGIVERSKLLPDTLITALSLDDLSPTQVTGLLPLLDYVEEDLVIAIADKAGVQSETLDLKLVMEELAREEVLRFGQGLRGQVTDKLLSLNDSDSGGWLKQLARATRFHLTLESDRAGRSKENQHPAQNKDNSKSESLNIFNWKEQSFTSAEEINTAYSHILSQTRNSGRFISASAILDRMGAEVALADWAAHLEALSQSESLFLTGDDLISAICNRIEEWTESPSVAEWSRERLLQFVIERLPALSRWLIYNTSSLPTLLKRSSASEADICASLLAGIEQHVDSLGASTVYALIGLVSRYCTSGDAAQVMERYVARLVQRIPIADRDIIDLTDVPTKPTNGLARFLYVLMGDVDVRIRWQSAHALRSLARLGCIETIDRVIALYDRTNERTYRRPDAPFYWLASRLWLVIALDRIASESPLMIQHHHNTLLTKACDKTFPHVLLRAFAKSAISKLLRYGTMALNATDLETLNRVNAGSVPSKKPSRVRNVTFHKYQYEGRQDRRFTFDNTDSLPNWYSSAVGTFAELGKEEFLDVAERWIVERWDVTNDPWRWDDEPRQDRLSGNSFSSYYRQGSLQTAERFHTYLEWHAMWCTLGELMETRPLAKLPHDDYDGLERQLVRNGLSEPPIWLADLRGLKPLEPRSWVVPSEEINTWIDNVSDTDFLAELGSADDNTIVVDAYHDIRSRNFRSSTQIHSALVSSKTASALVRALQTVPHYADYRLPLAGDYFEIDIQPYKLKGWIDDGDYNSGIDERDPLRFDVGPIHSVPSDEVIAALDLELVYEAHPTWREARNSNTVFVYKAWSDSRWDDRGERILYSESVYSSGHELRIDSKALRAFLNKIGMDLIVEIQITRRNRGHEYSRYDQENPKESIFDKIILFRKNGTIEAADKCLGTWTTLSPRIGS